MSSELLLLHRQRFPSMVTYLGLLPRGLDSYPNCQVKASLLHSLKTDLPLDSLVESLPSALQEIVTQPPPVSSWIPEVYFRALLRASFDSFFRDRRKYVAWGYEAQRRVLSSPLYRPLFMVMSTERGFRLASSRWENFHKGVSLTVHMGERGGRIVFEFPAHLLTLFDLEVTMCGIRVALELIGARDVQLSELAENATSMSGLVTWR
jgi:hypothetical protein